ncbi:MAG: hypothetical protein OES57_13885 [Acidimicrobiia bacterium]|nr:hypothetical protein [Acidimicrobiia bacterium]
MTDETPRTTTASLPARMGARWVTEGDQVSGYVDVLTEQCGHGVVRLSVLAMLVDTVAGMAADQRAGEDWTFTADLSLRWSPRPIQRIDAAPTVLREGGRGITVDVPMFDVDGQRIGAGVSTFSRLARREGDPEKVGFTDRPSIEWPTPEAPLDELLAPRRTDVGLELDLRPEVLNPALVLQGGVAALLAELAAQHTLEAATGLRLVGTGMDIRYVSMGRVGPIRTVVDVIGVPGDLKAQVQLRDVGQDDRVVTHNLIGFAPAP